jgi:uncharacterized protein
MKLSFQLHDLEDQPLRLKGQLPPDGLDLDGVDELVQVREPLTYDLTAQKLADAILVQGQVRVVLACECSRCLRPFSMELDWPDWTAHLPLSGEDSLKLDDGAVDLTPLLREDTLLGFPQHPLCEPGCRGLAQRQAVEPNEISGRGSDKPGSVWSALNQLKLK